MELYTTTEAAAYLGIPRNTLKVYVTRGLITPDKRSRAINLFTRATLDRFRETPRPGRGRPARPPATPERE